MIGGVIIDFRKATLLGNSRRYVDGYACVPPHAVDLLTRRSDLAPPMSCDPIVTSQLTKGQPAVSPKRSTSTTESVSMPQPTQSGLQAPVQKSKPATDSTPEVEQSTKALVLGKRAEAFASSQTPVGIPVDVLARHMLVLGASGSGKTVTVRRVVEEAALLGIPSIVIDCAQDMCTFDEPRQEPSTFWRAGDVERAQRFAEQTEMVVWTPGRESGNPLRLETIPDFTALRDDEEKLQQAVDMAVGALQEIVAQGNSRTAESKRGILASSVKYFARHCSEPTLSSYIDMLGNLPEAAGIEIEKQDKLAQEMADSLKVALACNPLLRSDGAALDPAVLFGDDASRDRTRISTISFVGLPNQSSQRDFLNQLSMTLFAWIKRYPRPPNGRALRGLLVIDEARDFVPSQHSTVCKQSMQRLVAQARKYKLATMTGTQHSVEMRRGGRFF